MTSKRFWLVSGLALVGLMLLPAMTCPTLPAFIFPVGAEDGEGDANGDGSAPAEDATSNSADSPESQAEQEQQNPGASEAPEPSSLPVGGDGIQIDASGMISVDLGNGLATDPDDGSVSLDTEFADNRYWKLGGNKGTTGGTSVLGTTDAQSLELHVNNEPMLSLSPDGEVRMNLKNGSYISFRDTGESLFTTSANGARLTLTGNFVNSSDAALKENFEPVDRREVLKRLAAMPLSVWNYRSEGPEVLHMGPTAQDFARAFGLGDCDTAINTLDADGAALAAIQALYELQQERECDIADLVEENGKLRRQISELETRLKAMEAMVAELVLLRGNGPATARR